MKYIPFGNTGLRLSQVCLGTGNFGTRWGHGADLNESRAMFDLYAEAGGNFIDTSNSYQYGQSEEYLGEILAGRRENFLLATKYTGGDTPNAGHLVTGNSRKAMTASVEASLKRLKTDRIDLLWVHHPDYLTPSEEILRGLDDLARAGKILYAGLSNFPAWRIARAATLAELLHTVPVAAVQFEYSLVFRTPDTELIPAADALGLGAVTWSPLGGGMLTGKYRLGEKGRQEGLNGSVFQQENSAQRSAILDTVLTISMEIHATPDQVAIAWVSHRGVTPIIGPRSRAQLESNLGAFSLALSPEQLSRLDAVSHIASGDAAKTSGAALKAAAQGRAVA